MYLHELIIGEAKRGAGHRTETIYVGMPRSLVIIDPLSRANQFDPFGTE